MATGRHVDKECQSMRLSKSMDFRGLVGPVIRPQDARAKVTVSSPFFKNIYRLTETLRTTHFVDIKSGSVPARVFRCNLKIPTLIWLTFVKAPLFSISLCVRRYINCQLNNNNNNNNNRVIPLSKMFTFRSKINTMLSMKAYLTYEPS